MVVENETESGALGFFNSIKRESNGDLFKLVIIMDPEVRFDENDKFFINQLKKCLRVNVLKSGVWGSYRYLPLREEEMVKSEDAYCRTTQVGDMSSLKWFKRSSYEDSSKSSVDDTDWKRSIVDLELVATIAVGDKKLVLLKKIDQYPWGKFYKLKLDGSTFDWIPKLQAIAKEKQKTVMVVENETESGTLGFFNSIKRESNGDLFKLVIIMDPEVRFDENDKFFINQLKKCLRVNVLKGGVWGSYRYLPLREEEMVKSEDAYCRTTQVGDMSSLKWFKRSSYEDSSKSSVDVYYNAINFKDITDSLGLINPEVYTKSRIDQNVFYNADLEYSGKDWRGKRVMGFSMLGGTLSNRIFPKPNSMYDVPDGWSLQEAATVPVCYSTVIFVFTTVKVREGESILIHAGSGGIGQAAIHIATFYKCNIFTTVGSKEKREFVRKRFPNVPDCQIGNSRDTSFIEMVLKQTRGRGVDVVLNSLSEDKLQASLRCLARRGRFAEIGKLDMLKNHQIELNFLPRGIAFYGFCLQHLSGVDLTFKKKCDDTMRLYLKEGIVKPLHYTVFNYDEVEQAYRTMASAKHVGKLLLRVRDEDKPPTIFNCFLRFHCNPDLTYIIVGGLGGVGLELADWLVVRGARKLVLVSRTGTETGYTSYRLRYRKILLRKLMVKTDFHSSWRSQQVRVKISTHDVTTPTGCAALLNEATQMGEVTAIFNLALVLMDDAFEDQNETKFLATLNPKATATRLLDALSRDLCPNLSHFVVFSSMISGIGNIGQTPYGMANSITERICENRKKDGYPALAIQWGAIGDVGAVSHLTNNIQGSVHQKVESCLAELDKFLTQNEPVVSCMVVADKGHLSDNVNDVLDVLKNILGITDLKTISEHTTLPQLGMDSMAAIEIKLTLERECQIYLKTSEVRNLTFAKVKDLIDKRNIKETVANTNVDIDFFYIVIGNEEDVNVPIRSLKSLVEDGAIAPTVYFLPGTEGVGTVLEPLAKNIDARVQCLQYVYNTLEDDSVKSLSECCFSHIPPDETFKIVAYSYGCIVALELASMLEARGQRGTLILIDSSPEMMKNVIIQRLNADSVAVVESAILSTLMQILVGNEEIYEHRKTIFKLDSSKERIDYVFNVVKENKRYSPQYLRQVLVKICTRMSSIMTYEPSFPKLQSSVTLFKPSVSLIKDLENDYGLSKYCQSSIGVEVFEGDHITVLDNVEMARKINCILKEDSNC
ncbi:hypothetical protein FQR65_LT16728 [Abscondita terminalis]|nr:hypothetical protein FQR65_LT16728 [Abscondita terminalis]